MGLGWRGRALASCFTAGGGTSTQHGAPPGGRHVVSSVGSQAAYGYRSPDAVTQAGVHRDPSLVGVCVCVCGVRAGQLVARRDQQGWEPRAVWRVVQLVKGRESQSSYRDVERGTMTEKKKNRGKYRNKDGSTKGAEILPAREKRDGGGPYQPYYAVWTPALLPVAPCCSPAPGPCHTGNPKGKAAYLPEASHTHTKVPGHVHNNTGLS